jgi:hypothetical protein
VEVPATSQLGSGVWVSLRGVARRSSTFGVVDLRDRHRLVALRGGTFEVVGLRDRHRLVERRGGTFGVVGLRDRHRLAGTTSKSPSHQEKTADFYTN